MIMYQNSKQVGYKNIVMDNLMKRLHYCKFTVFKIMFVFMFLALPRFITSAFYICHIFITLSLFQLLLLLIKNYVNLSHYFASLPFYFCQNKGLKVWYKHGEITDILLSGHTEIWFLLIEFSPLHKLAKGQENTFGKYVFSLSFRASERKFWGKEQADNMVQSVPFEKVSNLNIKREYMKN